MTLRDKCTPQKRRAHAVLDAVRLGVDVDRDAVEWALRILGELT